jgi:hypothetical protein
MAAGSYLIVAPLRQPLGVPARQENGKNILPNP